MEEKFAKNLDPKVQPLDFEKNCLSDLKLHMLDLNKVVKREPLTILCAVTNESQKHFVKEEFDLEQHQLLVKTEPEVGEDKAKLENNLQSVLSDVPKTAPDDLIFVDPCDVSDNSISSIRLEETDPLSNLKQEPQSCSVAAQHLVKCGPSSMLCSVAKESRNQFGKEAFYLELHQALVKTEPEGGEDKVKLENDNQSESSHVLNKFPESMLFVDLGDVSDDSTSSIHLEETDPLSNLKQELQMCSAVAKQGTKDLCVKNVSCVSELPHSSVTCPVSVHLERLKIPLNTTIDSHHLVDGGLLESLSSNASSPSLLVDAGVLRNESSVDNSIEVSEKVNVVTKNGSCFREQRNTPVMRPCFVHLKRLDIPGNLISNIDQVLVPGPLPSRSPNAMLLQPQASDVGSSHCVSPFKKSIQGSDSSIQIDICDKQGQDCSTTKPRHQLLQCSFCFQKCPKSFVETAHDAVIFKNQDGVHPNKCCNCQNMFTSDGHHKRLLGMQSSKSFYHCSPSKKGIVQKAKRNRHKGERLYQCSHCNKIYRERYSLSVHLLKHSGELPYRCFQCKKGFRWKANFNTHMRIHNSDRLYQCSECDKSFTDKSACNRHIISVHTEERAYHCSVCNKRFKLKHHLITHMLVHSGERPYQCPQCNKRLAEKCSLNKHLRLHTAERPYQCLHCSRRFAMKSYLNKHIKHTCGERPYHCSKCTKQFKNNIKLSRHMVFHSRSGPYQCSQCNYRFAEKRLLTSHLILHSSEGPYQCSQCNKHFTHKNSLIKHLKLHSRERPHNIS